LHHRRPARLHELGLYAERLGERLRHIDVKALEGGCPLVQKSEWPVVAGHTDTQGAAAQNLVDARSRRLCKCSGGQSKTCDRGDGRELQVTIHFKLPDDMMTPVLYPCRDGVSSASERAAVTGVAAPIRPSVRHDR